MNYAFFKGDLHLGKLLDKQQGKPSLDLEKYGLVVGAEDQAAAQGHDAYNSTSKKYEGDFCQLIAISSETKFSECFASLQQKIADSGVEDASLSKIDLDTRDAKKTEIVAAKAAFVVDHQRVV